MCRWFSYVGEEPVLLADLLVRPKHSVIRQIDSHYLPDVHIAFAADNEGSPNIFSNMDGYGIGYYTPTALKYDLSSKAMHTLPCVFKSIRPPLNDRNLLSIAENTETNCAFAHIRAGTGLSPVVETSNHPFQFGRFLFQHNGVVDKFFEIRIPLLQEISPAARALILGTTDTETAAALFFTHLEPSGPWMRNFTLAEMQSAMKATISDLQRLINLHGGDGEKHSALNFAVTDGQQLVTTRFAHPVGTEPPSLYWSKEAGARMNRRYEGDPDDPEISCPIGGRKFTDCGRNVIVASEPATFKEEEWHLIPPNMMLSVGPDFEPVQEPLTVDSPEQK